LFQTERTMIDRTKRYLQKLPNDNLHIGNLIAWVIQEKHLKKVNIAQQLNIKPASLNQYFKQSSIQLGILWRLSQIMEYNFLSDLADRLPIPFETKKEVILNNMLSEKEEELKSIKKELNLLKKIHKIE
jgi:hypothetical protein